MIISGLQKMTLLDYPGKVACTAFLHGCNFRCPFCHNSGLLMGEAECLMTAEEFLSFLQKRRGLLDAVCISGGEPTLQPGLPALLESIRALGFAIKLDTNGSRPDVLRKLIAQGLVQYIAMDIKNSPACYEETVGIPGYDIRPIAESLRLLAASGMDYELRTTVVAGLHDAQSIADMGRFISETAAPHAVPALYLQQFVDRDSVLISGLTAAGSEEMQQYMEILRPFARHVSLRGQ